MTTVTKRWTGDINEIEQAVEAVLARQLLQERMRTLPNEIDRETLDEALGVFREWADCYGLPTTPHVLAAFLLELRKVHQVEFDTLMFIAHAYLRQADRDVHVPIYAAPDFCSSC
jgi:hypothetical protein